MCLAVPGQVRSIYDDQGTPMAEVDFGGVSREVCLAFVPETQVGQYVIVHVGFAISRIDEQAALQTLRTFEELDQLEPPR